MIEWPLSLELTPNGKTLAVLRPSDVQGRITASLLRLMGQPEIISAGEDDPENILILWPHCELPDELYDLAERMTSANLLQSLGFDRPDDDSEPALAEDSPAPQPDPHGIEEYEVVGSSLAPDISEGDLVSVDRSRAAADGDIVFMPWRERQCIVARYRVNPGGQHYLQDRYGNHRIPADAIFSVVIERRRVLRENGGTK